jgi:hypothetical protein
MPNLGIEDATWSAWRIPTTVISDFLAGSAFGPEPSVFSVAVEKLENWNIQDYDFACGSVWVWNLVSDTKGGI